MALQGKAQFRETYFERGYKEVRKENFSKAIEYFNYSLSDRDYFQAYFFRGYAKFQLGDLIGSEGDLNSCLTLVPTHREALHYRAIVRSQLLDYENAFADFKAAIELDSNNAEIYLNRAITLLSIQNYEAALADCNSALKRNPNNYKARIIKAVAETELGDYELALTNLNAVLTKEPNNVLALTQRAACFREMKRFEEAESDLDFVLLKDSTNVEALLQLAMLQNERGFSKQALELLNKVLSISPYNSTALFNRAVVKTKLKDEKGALADYNQVLLTNSRNVSALFNRAVLYERMGQTKKAIDDFDEVIDQLPNMTEAYVARAQLKKKLNDYAGAEEDLRMADYSVIQNQALAEKGLSPEQMKTVMEAVKLSNKDPNAKRDTSQMSEESKPIRLRSYFQMVPPHFSKHIVEYYKDNDKTLTENLIGLIAGDSDLEPEQLKQEIDSLQQIEQKNIQNSDYYLKRGLLYTQLELYNEAFQDFETTLSLDSNNVMGYFSRANTRLQLIELLAEFEVSSEITIAGKPQPTKTEKTVIKEHTYEMVDEDYESAIRLDSSFPYAYFNKAYAQNRQEKFRESVETLSEAIALKGNFAEAYFNRGLTQLYLKNNKKGCADLSKAGELGIEEAYNIIIRYCSY